MAGLPDGTSIFLAELHAVYLALKFIESKRLRHAVICSDSRSVIQSMARNSELSPLLTLVLDKHQELNEAGVKIQFLWIPGHSGIKGNERADQIAKDALTFVRITQLPSDFSSLKSSIRRAIYAYWQSQWENNGTQTQLKTLKPKIQDWSSAYRKNRQEEKVLARLRIGHTYLTHHFIYSKDPRPRCTQCAQTLTVKHIIFNCQKFERYRRPLVEYCRHKQLEFSLPHILGDDHPELLCLLFVFLKNSQLMNKL